NSMLQRQRCGSRRNAWRTSRRYGPLPGWSLRSRLPPRLEKAVLGVKTRWWKSCAAGSKVSARSRPKRWRRRPGSPGLDMQGALAALQVEGFAMRGRFTPGAVGEEWCERRLLARIHGYTVKRLRAEIEPVAARDFLRFLLSWQHVAADARMQGPDAIDTVA